MGSTTELDDERIGVSLMLATYVERNVHSGRLSSGILPPFMFTVFNGKTGDTLDKRFEDWSKRPRRSGSMNFQKWHWFYKVITLRWINWLIDQLPRGKRIGLVWDACPSHLAQLVQDRLAEFGHQQRFITADIPGGMTSILQLGDICINGFKKSLRGSYLSYTMNEVKRMRAKGEKGNLW